MEFYEKLVKESDYLMFTPKETAEKAKQEQKYIEDYDDYHGVAHGRSRSKHHAAPACDLIQVAALSEHIARFLRFTGG